MSGPGATARRRPAAELLALLALAGCATAGSPDGALPPPRAADFRPSQLRQAAVVVWVELAAGLFDERERAALPLAYEGALQEALNARAVLVRDLQAPGDGRPDPRRALARAREVGADHAILVEVRVDRGERIFCHEGRRPFRAPATVWRQAAAVYRAADGAGRLHLAGPALEVTDVEADCDDPRASRRRAPAETAAEAVSRLLARLLGP